MDLWNVGKLLPDYTALQSRRQPSSYSTPWEPQIDERRVMNGGVTMTTEEAVVACFKVICWYSKELREERNSLLTGRGIKIGRITAALTDCFFVRDYAASKKSEIKLWMFNTQGFGRRLPWFLSRYFTQFTCEDWVKLLNTSESAADSLESCSNTCTHSPTWISCDT
jgi:hypothetical protein